MSDYYDDFTKLGANWVSALPDFNAILDESHETAEHYQSPESLAENSQHAPKNEMVPLPIEVQN